MSRVFAGMTIASVSVVYVSRHVVPGSARVRIGFTNPLGGTGEFGYRPGSRPRYPGSGLIVTAEMLRQDEPPPPPHSTSKSEIAPDQNGIGLCEPKALHELRDTLKLAQQKASGNLIR